MEVCSFKWYGHKLTIVKHLPYSGTCCNCGKCGYNRLENHTTNSEVYLCDECLAETFED